MYISVQYFPSGLISFSFFLVAPFLVMAEITSHCLFCLMIYLYTCAHVYVCIGNTKTPHCKGCSKYNLYKAAVLSDLPQFLPDFHFEQHRHQARQTDDVSNFSCHDHPVGSGSQCILHRCLGFV